jgi:hypothetical protein
VTTFQAVSNRPILANEGVYVVGLRSGSEFAYRFTVPERDSELLGEIQAYASHYGSEMETNLVDKLEDEIGWPDAGSVVPWSDFTRERNSAYLSKLQSAGVSSAVVSMIAEDVNVQGSRERFGTLLEGAPFSESEKAEILQALKFATSAHRLQASARQQDQGDLAHIPYVQHCVAVACLAMECGASAPLVVATLLHDVLEDTKVSRASLERHFSPSALVLVDDATRKPGESRSEFMARVATLEGDSKLLKCLDRFHNMLRAFSASTASYPERNIAENKTLYNQEFASNPRLAFLRANFELLNEELGKYARKLPVS